MLSMSLAVHVDGGVQIVSEHKAVATKILHFVSGAHNALRLFSSINVRSSILHRQAFHTRFFKDSFLSTSPSNSISSIMGVTKTVIKQGNGVDKPKSGDTITMEYTGWLHDSSAANNKGKQ